MTGRFQHPPREKTNLRFEKQTQSMAGDPSLLKSPFPSPPETGFLLFPIIKYLKEMGRTAQQISYKIH